MADKPLDRFKHSITYGNIWPYVLILSSKNEVYAYTLPNKMKTRFGFKPNKIMVYVVLYKLEAGGYIRSEYKERRKYYTITKDGRRILKSLKKVLSILSNKI